VGEVVVVVGSSADPTAAVAAAHGARIIIQSRPGYGAACWQGAREAAALGAEIVVFLDGDYADPPMELAQVMGPVLADEADLVLGCRDVSDHPDALPLHSRLGNSLVLTALRVLLGGSRFCDLPSFKAIRVEVLEALEMREIGSCPIAAGYWSAGYTHFPGCLCGGPRSVETSGPFRTKRPALIRSRAQHDARLRSGPAQAHDGTERYTPRVVDAQLCGHRCAHSNG